jgi:hypothetical protein
MFKRSFLVAALLLSLAVSLAAHPNSQPDFLRAYVHALILASEANRPFDTLPHYETGSREQITAFAEASKVARATLTQAIDEITPFTTSINQRSPAAPRSSKARSKRASNSATAGWPRTKRCRSRTAIRKRSRNGSPHFAATSPKPAKRSATPRSTPSGQS